MKRTLIISLAAACLLAGSIAAPQAKASPSVCTHDFTKDADEFEKENIKDLTKMLFSKKITVTTYGDYVIKKVKKGMNIVEKVSQQMSCEK